MAAEARTSESLEHTVREMQNQHQAKLESVLESAAIEIEIDQNTIADLKQQLEKMQTGEHYWAKQKQLDEKIAKHNQDQRGDLLEQLKASEEVVARQESKLEKTHALLQSTRDVAAHHVAEVANKLDAESTIREREEAAALSALAKAEECGLQKDEALRNLERAEAETESALAKAAVLEGKSAFAEEGAVGLRATLDLLQADLDATKKAVEVRAFETMESSLRTAQQQHEAKLEQVLESAAVELKADQRTIIDLNDQLETLNRGADWAKQKELDQKLEKHNKGQRGDLLDKQGDLLERLRATEAKVARRESELQQTHVLLRSARNVAASHVEGLARKIEMLQRPDALQPDLSQSAPTPASLRLRATLEMVGTGLDDEKLDTLEKQLSLEVALEKQSGEEASTIMQATLKKLEDKLALEKHGGEQARLDHQATINQLQQELALASAAQQATTKALEEASAAKQARIEGLERELALQQQQAEQTTAAQQVTITKLEEELALEKQELTFLK